MKLEGVFLYYDKENENGRIYTKEVAKNIIKQFNEINEGTVLGELGINEYNPGSEISLEDVSHQIKDLWIDEEEQCIKGTIKVIDTNKGKLLETLMKSDASFSIAPRGTGNVNSSTGEIENYQLYSFDIIPTEESSFKG